MLITDVILGTTAVVVAASGIALVILGLWNGMPLVIRAGAGAGQ